MVDLLPPSISGMLSKLHRRQGIGDTNLTCVPGDGDASLPNCQKVNDILTRCNALTKEDAPKQDIIDCFCTQELLNAYVGCKNDVRLCSLSYSFDVDFDREIKNWDDTCRPYLPSTLTTPAAVTLTETYDEQACQTAYLNCKKLGLTYSSCSSAYTQAIDLFSCRCRSDVLTLASECESGGVACSRTTPDPSSLWSAQYCAKTPTMPPATDSSGSTTTAMPRTTDIAPMTPIPSVSFEQTRSITTSEGSPTLNAPWLHVLILLVWGVIGVLLEY